MKWLVRSRSELTRAAPRRKESTVERFQYREDWKLPYEVSTPLLAIRFGQKPNMHIGKRTIVNMKGFPEPHLS